MSDNVVRCTICKRELNTPGDPTTIDCGGDCLKCMAEAGDPEAVKDMAGIKAGNDWRPHHIPAIFPSIGTCYCEVGEFRIPQVGEFYLHGGAPDGSVSWAWLVSVPVMKKPYRITRPTFVALPVIRYKRGKRILSGATNHVGGKHG